MPAATTQVVLVVGEGPDSARAAVSLWHRDDAGWHQRGSWQGHNGASGWTDDHREGDLRTPAGVFTLSDAGGRLPDPGAGLPYHRSDLFVPRGAGVLGEPLDGCFDHVVAIDYNRVPGRSPMDRDRPLGAELGGGIWLHVDHGGPTHGCVSVPLAAMRRMLAELVPEAHPVVVMADRARLAA